MRGLGHVACLIMALRDFMRQFITLLLAFAFTVSSQAQYMHAEEETSERAPLSIALEMKGYGPTDADYENAPGTFPARPDLPSRKSPVLAGILSLAIPGVGEVYAGNYLLAGLFAALEATGWYFAMRENNRGDDATDVYEGYADQNWSVVKYAEWLNANAHLFPGGDKAVHIDINPDASLPPWQRVNWDQMHTTEMAIPQFSHRLPPHGDQQYYELIGKYNQYSYGWNDKNEGDYWNASSNFLYYSGLRGDANRHYDNASGIINLIIVNHFLSAIDAAWAAARVNKDIEFRSGASLRPLPDGRADLYAGTRITWRF